MQHNGRLKRYGRRQLLRRVTEDLAAVNEPRDAPLSGRPVVTDAYSITRVACTMITGGIVRPIALAVFKLTTNSNVIGRSIGKSIGFAPLKMRSTK